MLSTQSIDRIRLRVRRGRPEFKKAVAQLVNSGYFDEGWYLEKYPDVRKAGLPGVEHYLLWGASEGRDPSPAFSSAAYLEANPDVRGTGQNPLLHYVLHGRAEGRLPGGIHNDFPILPQLTELEVRTLSQIFDQQWYSRRYGNVISGSMDPFEHYVTQGYRRDYSPSESFDPAYYRANNPDVDPSPYETLRHYLAFGFHEGRAGSEFEADVHTLSASGLFDLAWCRNRYPGLAMSGASDFVRQALLDHQLCPGPMFDANEFLSRYPDIQALGAQPLLWFLRHGERDARIAYSCFGEEEKDVWGSSEPLCLAPAQKVSQSVIVVVHVFYIEIFEEICHYLKSFPCHFNLVLTSPRKDTLLSAESMVRRYAVPATIFSRICQNRGRNFGPMLAEFRELILQHEVVLHLHTKKSPHNGDSATSWRTHLYQSLIGSRFQISAFLKLLQSRRLGVLYPSTHDWLPYWAHHWLSNQHLTTPFFQKINVRYQRGARYLDFAVGSMFWANVDALRPLFEHPWLYEDFPEEQGQLDGTTAHVIERSLCIIAKSRQYGHAEFDYARGSVRFDWSRMNLHQYAAKSLASAKAAVVSANSVSFDVFDTLVTRRVLEPDSLLRFVSFFLAKQHGIPDFFDLRKAAEAKLRQAQDYKGDVTIVQIYGEMARIAGWSEAFSDLVLSIELGFESKALLARKDVCELLAFAKSRGVRTLCISDTYMPQELMKTIPAIAGLLNQFERVYLSCETGRRKDRGDIWDHLLMLEGLEGKPHYHFGDNEHSDAQLAGDRKLGVYHLMSPRTMAAHAGIGLEGHLSWQTDILLGPVVANLFNSPFLKNGCFQPVMIESEGQFGYAIFGPLLFAFFSWLLQHPATQEVERLHFLSREGFFLHSLFKRIPKSDQLSIPSSAYLYVSRRAAIAASLARSFDAKRITFGAGFAGTVQKLIKTRLGVDLPDRFGLGKTEVRLPQDEEYVCHLLDHLAEYLVNATTFEHGSFSAYCTQEKVSRSSGLIDVGYSASIQDAMQEALGFGLTGFYLGTTPDAARVHARDGFAFGCFAERESFADTESTVLRHCRLLETVLTAPHGQVLRFEQKGDRIVPVLKPGGRSQASFPGLQKIYGGIETYFDEMFRSFGPEAMLCEYPLDDAQLLLKALAEHKIVISDELASMLYLEDEFCGNQELHAGSLATSVAV